MLVDNTDRRIDSAAYLQSAMDDNVAIGRFVGRKNFLPMMKRYTAYFPNSTLQLSNAMMLPMKGGQGGEQLLVRTQGDYSAWMSMHTIEAIFPPIVNHAKLVQQLLSCPLEGQSQFDFVLDCATQRIVRFNADMNFLPAFMKIAPDPLQLAYLFHPAKISEEMFIGELNEFEESKPCPVTPASCDAGEGLERSPREGTLNNHPVVMYTHPSRLCRVPSRWLICCSRTVTTARIRVNHPCLRHSRCL